MRRPKLAIPPAHRGPTRWVPPAKTEPSPRTPARPGRPTHPPSPGTHQVGAPAKTDRPSRGTRPFPRPILGVDIDNVLAQSDACLREMIRRQFRIRLNEKDMTKYDYSAYGITEAQLAEVFQAFNTELCRTLKVIPGAKAALTLLAPRFEIILVTSRNPASKEGTEYWLRRKGLPYNQLHFNDEKHALGIPYQAFVEDRHEHAHRIAEAGARVFLMTRPWNAQPLAHPNVQRVKTWREILRHLL